MQPVSIGGIMCELLAPAGSYESILAAVNAGADAVYAGGRLFGARAYADNPDEEQLIRGIEYCHLHGRKLYLTVNTLLKEHELESVLYSYLLPYYENGVDGLIVQDFGVMRFVRECFPGLPVHASTQMTVTGPEGARLLKEEGVTRVVVARELSLEEIRAVTEESGIEVEAFVHGAMCYSYSGRCLFSSLLGGRSGNRGRCAQPCRLPYRVGNVQSRQGETAFHFSMKDMCALDLLPELLDAGIASLKIEGRMKRPEYTAGVVSVYRKYMDRCGTSGKENYCVEDEDINILLDLYNRGGFSKGYYQVHNGRDMMSLYRPNHRGTAAVRVSVGKGGKPKFTALEPLGKGDVLELEPPGGGSGHDLLSRRSDASGAASGREFTLGEDVGKGEPVRISQIKGWHPRDGVIYRTKNTRLLENIKAQYMDRTLREKVTGELIVPADGPASLRLSCRGVRAECRAEIAEPSRNQPTGADTVRRQLSKTGSTPFEFEELKISLADGLFVPVAKLNELRRAGLSLLQEKLLAEGRRTPLDGGSSRPREPEMKTERRPETETEIETETERKPGRKAEGFRMNVLVTTGAQLEALLECGDKQIDTVYLDSLIFGLSPEQAGQLVGQVKNRGWRCFLNGPGVLRDRDRAFFSGQMMQNLMRGLDGFLLHTVDELAFFRDFVRENRMSAVLAADDDFYAYNSRAAAFLGAQGIERFTLPAELNFRELLDLDVWPSELNVYGYQRLMQSAQCVVKNTDRCTGIPKITYLTDRKNAAFPVLNRCPFCCSTVYNSVPLQLCGCRSELERLAPAYVRLSFTIETKEETAEMIKSCRKILNGEKLSEEAAARTTRGHFRRGVE